MVKQIQQVLLEDFYFCSVPPLLQGSDTQGRREARRADRHGIDR